ncbi:MAG: class I SAM-dependent methyltransferase, partial [Candidatus Nanopelagicales bacterium]|nr:class I SAM-dependent methyltransferase [Candidatus Nanopelagicales bacterium]
VVFELTQRDESPLRITAVDVAPGMVELLRADVAAAGLEAVSVQLADIEHLEVPDASVDAVTASMVLFFLPDLLAGLREIRRVLRPRGIIAFSVFGPSDPQWTDVYDAFLPFLPENGGDLSRPRHPALATPEGIAATLAEVGFREVRSEQIVHEISFDSVEQWHAWSWSIGLRGAWLSIPEEVRPRARAAVLEQVGHRVQADGGLMERFAVEYVTAER